MSRFHSPAGVRCRRSAAGGLSASPAAAMKRYPACLSCREFDHAGVTTGDGNTHERDGRAGGAGSVRERGIREGERARGTDTERRREARYMREARDARHARRERDKRDESE